MFYLYHHHDLSRLAELLAALLERRERAHPLVSDTVVVPNRGVGRWLQMALAQNRGVAANLKMPLLARFIWDLIPECLPGAPESRDFERGRLRWHLYSILPEVAKHDPAVASYLEATPRAVHRLQLADRLADVFDEYLIYRPRMLMQWEAGQIRGVSPDRWQALVWRTLTERLGTQHRAALLHRFIAAIDTDDQTINEPKLPEPVICFGLGHLPPDYVKFLYALGQCVDVHFLLPNPCDGYWGDIEKQRLPVEAPINDEPVAGELEIEAGHPLLASLGRGTRDLLRVLYSEELVAIQEPELANALAYEPPAGDTLLERVQADIIRMQAKPEVSGMASDDASVQVHACHGRLREVQVLQDQLLDLLGGDPDLAARDIVVMMPTISDYAPAVHSVFGAAQGRHYLPYSLSDRARNTSHPIVASFQRVIDLPQARWTASEILEIAAVPAIMRRFGLDESALATAADWVAQAGVRWGYDAGTRAHFGAGAFAQNTWQFGLDRLLLGLAQSDEETLTAGVAPWSALEGGATAALGALWYLLDRLRTWQQTLESPAIAPTWQDRLNALVDDMFVTEAGDRAEQAALNEVHTAVAALADAAQCLDDEPLPWQTVREVLSGELAQPSERQPFLSGGVTFCDLMALRAVPFKVVCLLGMNDSAFPRQEKNRAFNILRAQPRLGDQCVRDDDRLLFLQALTAARSVFYISYTGTDAANGDECPPSPIVGEWLDFLHRHHFADHSREAFEARLVTRQPMHPFSARYFDPQPDPPRLFTFARQWQPASRAGYQQRIPAPPFVDGTRADPPADETIDLAQLRRFFDNPAQHFLREALAVNLESPDADTEDMEPLQLDSLRAYQLRAGLLQAARNADAQDIATEPDALWCARGVLPPPPLGHTTFAEQAEQVNTLLPIWHNWCGAHGAPVWVDIDLSFEGQRLTGRIENIWPDGIRVLRPGSLHMKHKLRAWIDYLVYLCAGHEGILRLAGLDGGAAVQYRARVDTETAQAQLAELLVLYRQGRREPLLFLPGLADTFLHHQLEKKKPADYALDKANEILTNPYSRSYEANDPYFRCLFTDEPPLGAKPGDTDFCTLAETIGTPVFQHLRNQAEDDG